MKDDYATKSHLHILEVGRMYYLNLGVKGEWPGVTRISDTILPWQRSFVAQHRSFSQASNSERIEKKKKLSEHLGMSSP